MKEGKNGGDFNMTNIIFLDPTKCWLYGKRKRSWGSPPKVRDVFKSLDSRAKRIFVSKTHFSGGGACRPLWIWSPHLIYSAPKENKKGMLREKVVLNSFRFSGNYFVDPPVSPHFPFLIFLAPGFFVCLLCILFCAYFLCFLLVILRIFFEKLNENRF